MEETYSRHSVAMTSDTSVELEDHLLRSDGQEDLCLAVYKPSCGATRLTAIIVQVLLPNPGDRHVRGVVTFEGSYILRAAWHASKCGGGLAILHSHPSGSGWQRMSEPDRDAESSYARLVREITGLPLVGLTLGCRTLTWSARIWTDLLSAVPKHQDAESVRVVGSTLRVDWNDDCRPPPRIQITQSRTSSCWGPTTQSNIARLRILVVGLGTIGLDVAIRLAATGIQKLGGMDFDSVDFVNLDRLSQADAIDVSLRRSKCELALRETTSCATAPDFAFTTYEASICEESSIQNALDYDLIFCCIDDHPWPRSILNVLAYSDLIPVIDGGVGIDVFSDGTGMRNATWRSHILRPGRPCMACIGQLELGEVYLDRDGLLSDSDYISGLAPSDRPRNQNVSAFSASASAALLSQFMSFVAAPAGEGEPGPLRFSLSTHWLEHLRFQPRRHCPVEAGALSGDGREVLVGSDDRANAEVSDRRRMQRKQIIRLARAIDDGVTAIHRWIARMIMNLLA